MQRGGELLLGAPIIQMIDGFGQNDWASGLCSVAVNLVPSTSLGFDNGTF